MKTPLINWIAVTAYELSWKLGLYKQKSSKKVDQVWYVFLLFVYASWQSVRIKRMFAPVRRYAEPLPMYVSAGNAAGPERSTVCRRWVTPAAVMSWRVWVDWRVNSTEFIIRFHVSLCSCSKACERAAWKLST